MKKRWPFLLILILLVGAGISFRWWFSPLVHFAGTNADAIQGLASLIQIIIWLGSVVLFWLGFLRKSKQESQPGTQPQASERSAQVSGNDNLVITGDNNRVVKPELEVKQASLREAYLNRVYETFGTLTLSGIDRKTASQAEARLNLSAVYTALLTLSAETQKIEVGMRGEKAVGFMNTPFSALELLNRSPRLVLLGDPGSGKSTFVNFVGLCMAGAALKKEPGIEALTAPLPPEEGERLQRNEGPQAQRWEHGLLLPVRVVLRDFAARGLPPAGQKATAKHLWDFLATELEACALGDYAPYLRKELLEQGGLLMLDGLDEVPEADSRREQIKAVIDDFASAHPKCRILVTSRTYAYQKQDWRLNNFTEAVLAPFSRGQIHQFIDRWYAHIAVLRGINQQDAQGRAELLKRAVFASDRLMGLAERPLLLTLMASLHAWRGGTLPEKREELYAETVDLLLDWWESPKVVRNARGEIINQQPSLAEWLKVDRQKVRGLLNELAYKAHEAQPDLAGTADISETELVTGLLHLSQNPDVNPARLVEFLTTRAGLLLPRGVGVYTFPHRTFQEYLAACHLTDHGFPEDAARLARQDPNRWREVCLLAGAKAARGGAFALWPLVDALCGSEPSDSSSAADFWGALLAGQAILENANLTQVSTTNQPKVERIRCWQLNILESTNLPAIERAHAGDTLASLGDLRFDPDHWFLPKDDLLGFIHIPAGNFIMGSDPKKDEYASDNEQPQHELKLPGYWIAKYPVTVAQFKAFTVATEYEFEHWQFNQVANHPVVVITWYEALNYCEWLEERLATFSKQHALKGEFWQGLANRSLHVTLPSEAEWEKAARGVNGRRYPWGDDFDQTFANTDETDLGGTSAVGAFPLGASPYALLDMSGNVWEWTRSLWGKDAGKPIKYPYQPGERKREDLKAGRDILRVLRGGSFNYISWYARCASRDWYFPDFWGRDYGFRIVVSPGFLA
ncbi:MAG TPA: SUMF1/EgtB/PvdO family nonheme iron enzyme [Anaerolineales bacterium]|nr:SUMF1/EgtB/PvdO family nonheme iron enzyme [Anaerolineales bacterium]